MSTGSRYAVAVEDLDAMWSEPHGIALVIAACEKGVEGALVTVGGVDAALIDSASPEAVAAALLEYRLPSGRAPRLFCRRQLCAAWAPLIETPVVPELEGAEAGGLRAQRTRAAAGSAARLATPVVQVPRAAREARAEVSR